MRSHSKCLGVLDSHWSGIRQVPVAEGLLGWAVDEYSNLLSGQVILTAILPAVLIIFRRSIPIYSLQHPMILGQRATALVYTAIHPLPVWCSSAQEICMACRRTNLGIENNYVYGLKDWCLLSMDVKDLACRGPLTSCPSALQHPHTACGILVLYSGPRKEVIVDRILSSQCTEFS